MTDYAILGAAGTRIPIGGRAVANIEITDNGTPIDISTRRARWYDQDATLLEDLTYSGSDATGTDIYGNASAITNTAGTGTYRATLVIDDDNYAPTATGFIWSVRFDITTAGGSTYNETYTFLIVPTSIDIGLDAASITLAVKRKAGLLKEVHHVAQNTTTPLYISLGSGIIYAIEAAYKNGVAITNGGGYTWVLYKTNVSVTSPAVNDHYLFQIQTRLSDTSLADYTNEATRKVLAELRPYYAGLDVGSHPTVTELIIDYAVGRIKEDLSEGVALESAHYRSGHDLKKDVEERLRMIKRGQMNLLDSTLATVSRVSTSLMGGRLHPDGDVTNRIDLLDRAQQRTGLYVRLHPEVVGSSPRDL